MDDKRIVVLLARRAAGEINAKESEELDNLLANHPDSVYYEEFMRELWKEKHDVAELDEHSFFKHKQRYGKELVFDVPIDEPSRSMSAGGRRKRLGWRPLVLCMLIFTVGALGIWMFILQDDVVELKTIDIVAERGVRKQFELPDGTIVWLNADSRLSYVDDMKNSKTRAVKLAGEAYFDVAKDAARPFTITTDKISIKVLGTVFNVKAYPMDNKTEATLIRGSIELSVNERPNEKILLKPNEKVAVIDHPKSDSQDIGDSEKKGITLTIGNLSKVQVSDGEYIQETSWVDDKLVFKNETMEELIPKLERWYNVNITVKDPKIMAYRCTSTITEENINQLLEALQFIHSFNFKIENHDVTIY